MKRLFIEPLDVLMFRSERPFIARESHVAKFGVISSLTFEGAIKSKIFSEFCKRKDYSSNDFQRKKDNKYKVKNILNSLTDTIKEKIKDDKELEELLEVMGHPVKIAGCDVNKLVKIFENPPLSYPSKLNVTGVFFTEKKTMVECFPVPNDIVKKEENKSLKLNPALKEEAKIPGTEKYACFSEYSKVESVDSLISFDALVDYLHGEDPNESWFIEKPYELEVRTGIKLEKATKRTVEGHLYTAEFMRLKENWGFTVWIDDQTDVLEKYFKENEIIRLGGEGKGAICRKVDSIDLKEKIRWNELLKKINEERRFKLYLATPSYFDGCEPPTKMLKEKLGVEKLELIASLPGKPVYIGGYDFALNIEKPLMRWANAGAVYYYEFTDEISEDVELPLSVTEENVDMRCAFIGRW